MQASKHEVEHALGEGIAIRGGMAPVAVVRDAGGRATALRVARCEAKIVGGRLEIKIIAGTEEDIEADLIVSAIGQAVDFTGLESLNNGKGGIAADKNYQVQGQPGMFVGGDVVRPHLLTTAIGHGAIAADGIDRHLRSEPLDKRPKIDVHSFDLHAQDAREGPDGQRRSHEPIRGTDSSTGAIHNYDNRSDRYVIPHDELFLGHFNYTPRNRRKIVSLTADAGAGQLRGAVLPLLEAQAQAEAKRCMSCGQCFECDNCVVYCPQTAVFKVPKSQVDHRPLCRHRLHQVHRLPHLQGRLPHRLHPDGPGRVEPRCARASRAATAAAAGAGLRRVRWRGAGARRRPARPHAQAGDRDGARRARSAWPTRRHAPQPHGLAQAPARRDRARRHPRRASSASRAASTATPASRPAAWRRPRPTSASAATATRR